MIARIARVVVWIGTAALVVLASRAIAYALAPPTLLSLELQRSAGGPRLVVVSIVALLLAAGAAVAIVGLAALALRERLALEPRLEVTRAGLRPAVQIRRFLALWGVTCAVFAYFESYLHWREGLGWHGLRCLTGPVHRDAIPILAALSLVAVAFRLCGEHLVAWIRRTVRRLFPVSPRSRAGRRLVPRPDVPPVGRISLVLHSRGPPSTWSASPQSLRGERRTT